MLQKSNIDLTIDPTKTALLLLHWQNEIASPGGKRFGDIQASISLSQTIDRTSSVLKISREKGVLIVYVNLCHRQGYPERSPRFFLLDKNYAGLGAWLTETWGVENIDKLKPRRGEIIVYNYSPSAFCYTELDLILRNKGITGLVLSGIATNWVVENTAREGSNIGYFIYTLSDCCNSFNDEMHNWPLINILPKLGVVLDSETYIKILTGNAH